MTMGKQAEKKWTGMAIKYKVTKKKQKKNV